MPAKAVELYLDTRRLIEEQVQVCAWFSSVVFYSCSTFLVVTSNFLTSWQSFTEPYSEKLLPDLHPAERHVFTLVLDLQETLIHYDWTVRPFPFIKKEKRKII